VQLVEKSQAFNAIESLASDIELYGNDVASGYDVINMEKLVTAYRVKLVTQNTEQPVWTFGK
jgi:hypothetical protein